MGFFGWTEVMFSFSFEAEAFLTLEILVDWLDFLTFSDCDELYDEGTGTADLEFFLIGLESALTDPFLATSFLEAIFRAGTCVFDILSLMRVLCLILIN